MMNQEAIIIKKNEFYLMGLRGMSFWYIWECLDGQKANFWKISQYVSTYEGHVQPMKVMCRPMNVIC